MDELHLRQLLRPLLKWWWLIAACTLIAAASSALYTRRQPPTYISRTTIMVGSSLLEPNPSSSDLYLASQLASAYVDMVQRSAVRAAAQEALGITWLPYYTARVIPNTQLIEVSVVDTDPVRAQAVAAELANQLIIAGPAGQGQPERQAFIEQQLAEMEAGITQTTVEIERVRAELTGMFSASQIRNARDQIAALESKLTSLRANYSNLLANSRDGATNTIHVLEPANLPTRPMGRDLVMNVAVAAALGFALAAAAAYLMHYLDNTLQNEEDIEERLALPTLGLVPRGRIAGEILPAVGPGAEPSPAMSDAFSALRLNIQATMAGAMPNTLLVSSPMIGDGKSSVSANLAVEFVRAGYNVLLVDADLRRPTLHRLFHLQNQRGFSSFLVGEEPDLDQLVQHPPLKGLSVLTSGPLPANPTHLLSRKDNHASLIRLAQRFDIVLLDSPPLTATVDASLLATQVEAVLLVISAGQTKRIPTARVVKSLRHLQAKVVGVVLNGVPHSHTVYHSDYGMMPSRRASTSKDGHAIPSAPVVDPIADANLKLSVNGSSKRGWNPLRQSSRKR